MSADLWLRYRNGTQALPAAHGIAALDCYSRKGVPSQEIQRQLLAQSADCQSEIAA